MRGLGTIINALAIVIGGVLGILFKRFLKERYQDTIIKATGFSVVFLGAAGTLSKILTVRPDGTLSTGGSMVMILSLALGALLGELWHGKEIGQATKVGLGTWLGIVLGVVLKLGVAVAMLGLFAFAWFV